MTKSDVPEKESQQSKRHEYNVQGLPDALSHYTDAVRFGDLLFISGLTAHDEKGNLIGSDDAAAQTEQILLQTGKVLAAVGAKFTDVLKVTVFLTDIEDRSRINPVREKFFGAAKPASTLVEVSRLALPGMKVEIEAIVGLHDPM